jgi:hypothetical protein
MQSDDSKRVEIALCCDEVFLFDSAHQMQEILSNIETKCPHLSNLCKENRESWITQLGPDYENKKK